MKQEKETGPTTIDLNGTWDFAYTRSKAPKLSPFSVRPFVSGEGYWGWDFSKGRSIIEHRPPVPPASAFSVSAVVPGYWDDQLRAFKQADWWPQAEMAPGPLLFFG